MNIDYKIIKELYVDNYSNDNIMIKNIIQLDNNTLISINEKTIYLYHLHDNTIEEFRGSNLSQIYCMINDNNYLISSGQERVLRVWNINTKICIKELIGHKRSVISIIKTISNYIISGSLDSTLRVWDITKSTGMECIHILEGHNDEITDLLEICDGIILSASDDKTLRLWNYQKGKCIQILKGHKSEIQKIIKIDSNLIVSYSRDNTIIVWNLYKFNYINKIITNYPITSLIRLTNSLIALGDQKSNIEIWNIFNNTKPIIVLESIHSGYINNLLQLNSNILISTCDNGILCSWDIINNKLIFSINKLGRINSLIKLNNNTIAYGGNKGKLIIINISCK